MPREWGISKKVYFPITDLYRFFKRILNKNSQNSPDKLIEDPDSDSDSDEIKDISSSREVKNTNSINNFNQLKKNNNSNNNILIVEEDLIIEKKKEEKGEEDSSLKLEKKRAKSKNNEKYLLRCVKVSKKFGAKKALNKVYLAVEEGECFGLLGPNGAGKTTLISIISGIISPSSGYCCIAGKYTNTSDTSYRDEIGICPQFDILWEDLTVREHLNYYFLLSNRKKGEKLHVLVNQIADRVCLIDHMDKKVRALSGGMKRKLSIAISLVGDPKLLLLDEPTTGLDPDARREVWDLLSEARVGRSMIITTHNMEEADILSTRIGIVTQGKLSCVGNQQYLKNRFGKGYNLTIATTGAFTAQKIIDFMKFTYPNSVLDSYYSNILMFNIPIEELNIADLFVTMRNRKDDLGLPSPLFP